MQTDKTNKPFEFRV